MASASLLFLIVIAFFGVGMFIALKVMVGLCRTVSSPGAGSMALVFAFTGLILVVGLTFTMRARMPRIHPPVEVVREVQPPMTVLAQEVHSPVAVFAQEIQSPEAVVAQEGQPPVVGDVVVIRKNGLRQSRTRLSSVDNFKWTAESTWMTNHEDAEEDAFRKAHERLIEYMQSADPPLVWYPQLDFVKQLKKSEREKVKDFGPKVGLMRCVILELELTPKHRAELLHRDHRQRVEERMLVLGQVLGGVVAFFAAFSGYVRLDERTKGFYRGWLRLVATGFVLAVCALLFLVAID